MLNNRSRPVKRNPRPRSRKPEDLGDDYPDGENDSDECDDHDAIEDGKDEKSDSEPPPRIPNTSDWRSNAKIHYRGTFIPTWAEAITDDFEERCVLGTIDYWLGLLDNGTVRAKGRYVYIDIDDVEWYTISCRELATWMCLRDQKGRTRMWRILHRLCGKGYILKERHKRCNDGSECLRIRLRWELIDKDVIVSPHPRDD
jgi:hypothetical protein